MGYIYQIRNTLTDAVYIGSTLHLSHRWWTHQRQLRDNRHHSRYLQRAWNKYGESVFEFATVEEAEGREALLVREQHHLDQRKTLPRRLTYNVCWVAGSPLGVKRTAASIRRMKASSRRLSLSAETRRKVADTWVERYGRTYSLRGPDGQLHSNIRNLRRFARDHNVTPSGLRVVVIGIQHIHKGWTLPDHTPVQYIITAPDGTVFSNVPELKSFCLERGLNYKCMHGTLAREKPWKGWLVVTLNNQRRRKGIVSQGRKKGGGR